MSPDHHYLASATTGTGQIWDDATGTLVASWKECLFVAFSPDGARIVTASRDRMVRLWDVAGRRELAKLEHPSQVASVTLSPDGARVATSTRDRIVRIWDAAGGRELASLTPPSPVTSAVFSPDGKRLVTTCWEGTVHIWDAATGREIVALNGHERKATASRFSPDGARVVTASEDNTARVWDAASGRALHILKHPARVRSVTFSTDGARLVTGAGKEARVFDAASGRELAVFKGHEGDVNDAAFSRDGTRIATASEDRFVRIFEVGGGAAIAVLPGHYGGANSIAFGADGQRIFTIGGVEGIMWAKLASASLPANIAGLWFGNFGPPNEPTEIKRERCMRSPIKINANGLIVFFDVSGSDAQAVLHLRCAPNLTCQIFAGAPGQGLDPQGTGNLEVSGNAGKLCLAAECHPIARCAAMRWTEQERKSGFAQRWETEVNAPR